MPSSFDRPASVFPRDLLLLAGLTFLGLALRLWGLGHESIWYDEAISLRLAERSVFSLLSVGGADPGNPSGYFLLLKAWLAVWGPSIENARALSALAGGLSVPAVWLFGHICRLPRSVNLLAGLLVAVSPPLVYLGQEARVFALFVTVATLAVACVALIERRVITWAWAGFALLGAAMMHLHYYGAFVLVTLGLHLAWWALFHDRRVLVLLAASAVVVVLAFLPWLPVFRWQLAQGESRSAESWWQHLALVPLFDLAGRTLIWKEAGVKTVAAADLAIVLLIFVPLLAALRRVEPRPGLLLWWVIGLPLTAAVVSLVVPMVHSHYLSPMIPALLLLVAAAVEAGWRLGPRWSVAVPALALVLVTTASLGRLYALPHKDAWRELALRTSSEPAVPVYFYEDIGADPFAYYRPNQPVRRLATFCTDDPICMQEEPAGFWMVLYLNGAAHLAEEAAIVAHLSRRFLVVIDEKIGRLRLLRCLPRP
jgi:4-amino-4-deoxy-L-arabinose transferase-like glycosyltransferase